jgi:DNA-binding protein HU-beta
MAKKDKKKKDKQKGSDAADAVEAVRSAVERTFQATTEGAATTSKRTRNLVDEVAAAASRIRETIEDLKILEDVRAIRTEIEGLARRVTALENRGAPSRPAPAKRTTAKRTPAKRTTAKRTPAKRSTAKRTPAKRTTAKRTPAKRTAKARPAKSSSSS